MLKQIDKRIVYTKSLKKYLRRLKPWSGEGNWKINTNEMKRLKKLIRVYLKKIQDSKCAYCGLKLEETSPSEIEHIAPKGGNSQLLYPQFTFTPYNLILACHYCNSRAKKGTKDTIITLDINYRKCEFNIVHPYFDNPNDHFEWIPNGKKILISSSTSKGIKSIEMFKLDCSAHNEARAKQVRYEESNETDDEFEDYLKAVLTYRV